MTSGTGAGIAAASFLTDSGTALSASVALAADLSPLSNDAKDPLVPLFPPKTNLVAPPNPEKADGVEADLAAKPPNPPEMFPTGVMDGLTAPAPLAGVDGLPKAEDPNPEDPNTEGEAAGVVDTGRENALGVVDDPKILGAGLEAGVEEAWPKAEEEAEPKAVAGLMNELEGFVVGVGLAGVAVWEAGFGVGGGDSSSDCTGLTLLVPNTGESGGLTEVGSCAAP